MVLALTNPGVCFSRSAITDVTCCCYDAVQYSAYAHPSCSYAPPCALGTGLCICHTGAALFSTHPLSPHLTVALCLLRRTTCCQIFLSSSMRTGFIRKSQAPCVTPRITVVCSSLADITAPTCKHTSTYNSSSSACTLVGMHRRGRDAKSSCCRSHITGNTAARQPAAD